MTTPPEPVMQRWQPLRAGLVDMFLYDIEEFHFHRGSLLLRGNNGTGKSKVLALTLPFLLDGELAAHRVEPDGDRQKRMEWNLLLGGRYTDRLGYTWLEFGRRADDGSFHYLTVGCGLKAVAGRGIARHWFFLTDQRVGPELSLVTAGRTALPRDRLVEALADRGRVFDRAGDYRRAVDEALFGLGARYEALVSLLIQLRAPQLTKRPDERLLSAALTDALPPLDENLLTQVAEAFRSLDDERAGLQSLREASRATDEFLAIFRGYAQVAAKRRAAELRTPHSRYEQLHRDLAHARQAHQAADEAVRAAERDRSAALADEVRLAARRRSLDEGPEARAARDLSRLRESAHRLAELAGREEATYLRLVREADGLRGRIERDRIELERAHRNRAEVAGAAAAAAERARIAAGHAEVVRAASADPDLPAARARADRLVGWRTTTLVDLDRLLAHAAELRRRHGDAERDLAGAQDRLTAADERLREAEQRLADAGAALVGAVRRHLDAAAELRLVDLDEVLAAFDLWVETQDGQSPVTVAVARAASIGADALGRAAAQVEAQTAARRGQEASLSAELAELAAGRHAVPAGAPTRAPQPDLPGAPMWQVVDFAEDVPDTDRAGIEAALHAAGLLDAWVQPDGTIIDPRSGEAIILPVDPVAENLTTVLRPAVDSDDEAAAALGPELVQRMLAGIGVGAGSRVGTWVDRSGRYGIGLLTGRWTKPAAEFIGEAARRVARRARIAALTVELDEVRAVLDGLRQQADQLVTRRGRLDDEVARVPTDHALREAHAATAAAQDSRGQAHEALAAATARAQAAAAAVTTAVDQAAAFAADAELPVAAGQLTDVRSGLGDYRVAVAAWWPACEHVIRADRQLTDASRHADEHAALLAPADDARRRAEREALEAGEQYATLQETAGASVDELHRQIAQVQQQLTAVGDRKAAADDAERTAIDARGVARGKQGQLADDLAEATLRRDEAIGRLQTFAGSGLLAVACPQVVPPDGGASWAPTPAVAFARAVDAALTEVAAEDRSWERRQSAVTAGFKALDDALTAQDQRATMTIHDGLVRVSVTFQSRDLPIAELATTLADEVAQRQRLLSAQEREVLENHLVNEVAAALQERIGAAETQVAAMNAELVERPTSTGMRLRLLWSPAPDAPAGLAELRRSQLRQAADVWNEQDRRQVGEFLQAQIDRQRTADDVANWVEQLSRALDYRTWHRFVIQRQVDGDWRPAAGPASGGERVLAASVPLFAAASSYYSSAGNPHSPRLIALDEAFAGVDDDARAKCLGLLAAFDLDVVMTSEREWGCYPQVPGLGISQLARQEGVDAVLVTPWRWDGRRRERQQRPEPYLPTEVRAAEVPAADRLL